MGRIWSNGSGIPINATNLNGIETDLTSAAKPWKASTSYTAGQAVLDPSGNLVTANAAHTSGTTFNPANWARQDVYQPKAERQRQFGTTITLATGQHNGFPYAVTASDGNLVVGWRIGSNHAPSKGVITVARYSQSGATLTAAYTAYTDATYDCRDVGLALLADGRLALSFFLWDYVNQVSILDGMRVMFSSDNGVTWGSPITVPSGFDTWASGAGAVVQLPDGTLLLPAYGVTSGTTYQHAHLSKSTDGGTTWTYLSVIANGDTDGRHYQEPNIILTDHGDLLAVIRSDTTSAMHTARSVDGGVTWTATTQAFAGSGAPRLSRQAGYVQCVFRDATTGRAVKVSSPDSGKTWGSSITLPISGSMVSSAYGVAVPYGKDSLRYIYSLQNGNPNNTATADLLQVDSIVPEDRNAKGSVGCKLNLSATVQVSSATWTSLTFGTEVFDTDQMHSTTTNTSRINIPFTGYYLVKGTVYFASSTAVQVQCRVIKNGSSVNIPGLRDKKNPVSGQDSLVTASDIVLLNAGDYLELQAYQDSGGAVSARTEDTSFTVALVTSPLI